MNNRFSLIGLCMIVVGVLTLMAAGGFWFYNDQENSVAADFSEQTVQSLLLRIRQLEPRQGTVPLMRGHDGIMASDEVEAKEMTHIEIDGEAYIGVLNIPALGLSLPVNRDWSYPLLKLTPCRYVGDIHEDNLVIMAHNYNSHFGELSTLYVGDAVKLTDADGAEHWYMVEKVGPVPPTFDDEVKNSGYDLTLFTCTYSGKARIVVWCNRF